MSQFVRAFGILVMLAASVALLLPAAPRLEIQNAAAGPYSSVSIPVLLHSEGAPISGIQFDLEYNHEQISLTLIPGQSIRIAGKSVYVHEQTRFLIAGLNSDPLPDGVLLTFNTYVDIGENTDIPMRIVNPVATDGDGGEIAINGTEAVIQVRQSTPSQQLTWEGVVNSASFTPGPVAPGELITLLGSSFGTAGDIAVRINGHVAPILFASLHQVNTMVPFETAGDIARIEILHRNEPVADLDVPLTAAAPGIFTQNGTGVGQASITDAGGTLISPAQPATKGSEITVFATGTGVGKLPVHVRIGGRDAMVLHVATDPTVSPGLTQIQVRLPEDVDAGPAIPVMIQVGSTESPLGTTMSIR